MYIYLENLFNGDKLMGATTNKLLNNNWRDIFDELRPAMLKAIGAMNLGVAKPVFDKVPYAELYANVITDEAWIDVTATWNRLKEDCVGESVHFLKEDYTIFYQNIIDFFYQYIAFPYVASTYEPLDALY